MKLRNFSKIYDDQTAREIIRLVVPSYVTNYDVMLKNRGRKGARGKAYVDGSSYHNGGHQFVVVSVAPDTIYPYTFPKRKGYLECRIRNELEMLVHMLAHELRHLWQKKVPRGHRVWGARGQYSERDADAYAIRMVRKFRNEGTPYLNELARLRRVIIDESAKKEKENQNDISRKPVHSSRPGSA